jgi:hypothetical protein
MYLKEEDTMALFFKTVDSTPVLKSAIERALKIDPNTEKDLDLHSLTMTAQIQKQTSKTKFSWCRFIIAFALLVILGIMGIWTATIPSLDAWSKMFLHSFEVVFGAIAGTLGIEASS